MKTSYANMTVYCFDENLKRARLLKESAQQAGFEAHFYSSENLFLQSMRLTMPHIVVLPLSDNVITLVEKINALSREILVFVMNHDQDEELSLRLVWQGYAFDCLTRPIESLSYYQLRLQKMADYWLGVFNEPSLRKNSTKVQEPSVQESLPVNTFSRLLGARSHTALLKELMGLFYEVTKCPYAYFQNHAQQEHLKLMDKTGGLEQRQVNLGISYMDLSPGEKQSFLKDPLSQKIMKDFCTKVFQSDEAPKLVYRFENEHLVFGYMVPLGVPMNGSAEVLQEIARMGETLMDNLYKSDVIHDHLTIDVRTQCLHHRAFYEAASAEISRARRLQLDVSAAAFQLSYTKDHLKHQGAQLVSKILQRFTRTTDVVGRVLEDEFLLIYPHTSLDNAATKSAQLTKIIETALKEKGWLDLQVSCGVSSYPSRCSDAMSLVESAEQAADQAAQFEVFVNDSMSDLRQL